MQSKEGNSKCLMRGGGAAKFSSHFVQLHRNSIKSKLGLSLLYFVMSRTWNWKDHDYFTEPIFVFLFVYLFLLLNYTKFRKLSPNPEHLNASNERLQYFTLKQI